MGIRCTTVAPETTTLRPKKIRKKRRRHFPSVFFGKRPVFFIHHPKRQLISPLQTRTKGLDLVSVNTPLSKTPSHHSPQFINLCHHPGSHKSNISIYPYSFT